MLRSSTCHWSPHGRIKLPLSSRTETWQDRSKTGQQLKPVWIHPLKRAEYRDQAQRPSVVKSGPCWRLRCSVNYVNNWTSPDKQKERGPHLKSCTCLGLHACCCDSGLFLEHRWKRKVSAGRYSLLQNWWLPRTAARLTWQSLTKLVIALNCGQLFNTSIEKWNEEKGQLFHFT